MQWDVYPVGGITEDVYPGEDPSVWLSKTSCSITDHFDGTYTICCRPPAQLAYGESKLTILADYVSYGPYQSVKHGKPREVPIAIFQWMGEEAAKVNPQALAQPLQSPLQAWPACDGDMSQLSLEGEWMSIDGVYRWVHPLKRCVTPIITPKEVQSCHSKDFDSLTMIGDSHLRQMSKWFYGYFGLHKLPYEPEVDTSYVEKVRFMWSTNGMRLSYRIMQEFYNTTLFQGRPLTNRDILVLDTAHWDLWDNEVTDFLNVSLPYVNYAVQTLR